MEAYNRSSPKALRCYKRTDSATMSGSGKISWTTTEFRKVEKWTDYLNGYKNPHWKDQVRLVQSATTDADGRTVIVDCQPAYAESEGYTRVITPSTFQPWTYYRHFKQYMNVAYPDSTVAVNPGNIDTTSADNQAIARLYDKLNAIQSPAQTGEDFGEWRQTVNLFRNPLRGFRDLVSNTMRNHKKVLNGARSAKALGRGLTDVYLEYQFGWRPLASSLASALVALQNREKFAIYVPFYASGKSESNPSQLVSGDQQIKTVRVTKDVTKVRYKGIWGAESGDIPQRTVTESLGLTARQIIPTIWNLIPYSFLIDYCTNLGTIVDSITVPFSNVRWCVKTVVTERQKFVSMVPSVDPSIAVEMNRLLVPGYYFVSDKRFSRRTQGNLPQPKFEVNFGLSGLHWANVAALVSNRLLGIKSAESSARQRFPTAHLDFDKVPTNQL